MSRSRNLPEDLHNVAKLAGTTAAVAEGAAVAAERAQAAAEVAHDLGAHVAGGAKGHRKGLLVLVVLALLAIVGLVIWKRSKGSAQEEEIADLRSVSQDRAGSMP